MTLEDIIEEADELYPNGLSTKSKIRKINVRESELHRMVLKKKTATIYDIIADNAIYPVDFAVGKILNVLVDGQEWTNQDYEENDNEPAAPPYYYTYENSVVLYPTPDQNLAEGLFIHHWYEPPTYSEDNLDQVPVLDPDFHRLHVYGLCADMAAVGKEWDVANGFIQQYNDLLNDLKKADPEPELPDFKVVR
ncbi:phage adaptor protein [Paenibacillus albus]